MSQLLHILLDKGNVTHMMEKNSLDPQSTPFLHPVDLINFKYSEKYQESELKEAMGILRKIVEIIEDKEADKNKLLLFSYQYCPLFNKSII